MFNPNSRYLMDPATPTCPDIYIRVDEGCYPVLVSREEWARATGLVPFPATPAPAAGCEWDAVLDQLSADSGEDNGGYIWP